MASLITASSCNTDCILGPESHKPNYVKDFPASGQGTLTLSIERGSQFLIVVCPKLDLGEQGANERILLDIKEDSAVLRMYHNGEEQTLKTVTGMVKNQPVGYEVGRTISYWFSYNRDLLTIKYGKGYCMQETTLLSHNFLEGVPKEKQRAVREDLCYLFSPCIARCIQQYDEMPVQLMIEKYKHAILQNGYRGIPLSAKWPKLKTSDAALEMKAEELAKSILNIEHMVEFDKVPFVSNWSPIVLDSSRVNLYELDSSTPHTFSASLPPACLELYTNIRAPDVELDWPYSIDKCKFSNAIRYSLNTKGCTLYEKLQSKAEFGSPKMTYLRVTLGKNRGRSPGVPYVLEIWPSGNSSPIHSHGDAYAIIKALHGGLTIKIFNKQVTNVDADPLLTFDVRKGDCTWISPKWFQTHQLWNNTPDYCATIQCYQYGEENSTHRPCFEYVACTDSIAEFLPDSDFGFLEMRDHVMREYAEYVKTKERLENESQPKSGE